MDAAQEWLELEAIKRLKARYFRCLDTKDWEGFGAVFTDDATLLFDQAVSTRGRDGDPAPLMAGRAAIVAQVSASLSTAETVHHGHSPEIDFLSDTHARGIWAMQDIVDFGTSLIHGYGHYHESYRKEDGRWRIASVHLTRLRVLQLEK